MTNTAKKRTVKSLEVSDNFLLYTSREKAADYRLFSQRTKQRQHLWLATVIAAIYTDYKNSIAVYKDNYQLLAEKFSPLQSEYIRNLPDTFGKKQQYIDLLLDENYEDVQYNPNNGGLKARHKNRGKYDSKGRKLELELMDYLYGLGHTVILLEDKEEKKGEPLSSLDMNLDGEPMDIRSKTKKLQSNTIKNDLSEKNKQLKKYNARIDVKVKGHSLCIYFPNKEYFEEGKITHGISDFLKFKETKHIKYLKCVVDGDNEIITYNLDDYK